MTLSGVAAGCAAGRAGVTSSWAALTGFMDSSTRLPAVRSKVAHFAAAVLMRVRDRKVANARAIAD